MNNESTQNEMGTRIKERVQQWLMEDGWQVGQLSAPDAKWVLNVNDGRGRQVLIVQPVDKKDAVELVAGLNVIRGHQERLSQLPRNEKHALIYKLRHALIQLDISYSGIGESLQLIQMSTVIYFDGLSKDSFLRWVNRVRNAVILTRGVISQTLAEPPPPPETKPQMGFRAEITDSK